MTWIAVTLIPFTFASNADELADGNRITPRYTVVRTPSKITIDGRLDERAWKTAQSVGKFRFQWWKSGTKEQTVAKLLWDDTHLYVSYQCQDAHIWGTNTKRDSPVYKDDCVEVFTAPNPKRPNDYFNIEMNVRGAILDQHHPDGPGAKVKSQWNSRGIKIAVAVNGTLNNDADTDREWILEAAIPFANFQAVAVHTPPKPGDVWRLNLNRLGGMTNQQHSQWSPSQTPTPAFHVPKNFGEVTFSKRPSLPRK